ncbi:alpha/beta hydrolase [Streptomyces anandii]|uniref:alpha/beta hydrolase n=1 Tax=Streptomyces anandii TaxID=285454 RepID=UPI00368C1AC2
MIRRSARPGRCGKRIRRPGAFLVTGALVVASLGAAGPAADARPGRPATAGPGLTAARADDGAFISHVTHLDERMLDLTVDSPAMRGSMAVRVILPRHWKELPQRTFPVLYLLQGAADDYTSWTRETDIEKLADPSDVLVVMPEGGRAGFYSDWWDYGRPTAPRWETFHTEELRQLMERAFRAGGMRALAGLSEGGLGALNYAARHPGDYRFAGSLSGIVDISDPVMQLAIALTCLRENIDPVRLWGRPDEQRTIWDAHNPSRMVDRLARTWVYLYAATGQPGGLEPEFNAGASLLEQPLTSSTYKLGQELRRAGGTVTLDLMQPGTHSWPYWKRELHTMWPSVLYALGASKDGTVQKR